MKATYPVAATELQAEARRDVERVKAAERREAAMKAIDAYHVANLGVPLNRVRVDANMRVFSDENDDAREAERKRIEAEERAHREREREREHAETVARRVRPSAPGITRDDGTVVYSP